MISEAREVPEDDKWCLSLRRAFAFTQDGIQLLPEFAPCWGVAVLCVPPCHWCCGVGVARSLRHTVLLPFLFLLFLGPAGDELREPVCGSGADTSGSQFSSAVY